MRILTWNINGLSTTLHYHPWSDTKSYENLLNALEADIICLQEIKCQRSKLTRDMALVPGFDAYFSFSKVKLGYSGVAVYVKQPLQPRWTEEGITGVLNARTHDPDFEPFLETLSTDARALDAEGRCIIMDFNAFILFNIYFPNDASEARRDFKMDYHRCVRRRIDDYLKQGKQVVLVGDINAVHEEIDHCDPKKSMKEHEITDFKALPHRAWLDQIIVPKGPLVDVCREYHPERRGMFTCWNMRLNSRPANYGTRIDYVLASTGLEEWFKAADIRPDILGSDHCPVYADFHEQVQDKQGILTRIEDRLKSESVEPSALFARNYEEFSDKQKKLMSWFGKEPGATTTAASPVPTTSPSNNASVNPVMSSTTATTTTVAVTSTPQKSTVVVPPNTISSKRKSTAQHPSPKKGQKLLQSYFGGGGGGHRISRDNEGGIGTNLVKEAPPSSSSPPPLSAATAVTSAKGANDKVDGNETVDLETLMNEAKERQVSKQSWNSLFTPKAVPLCTVHKEPCKLKTVTKKGPNQGRKFYVCSRPFGSNEQSATNEYQCDFFEWKHESSNGKYK
ncbi:Endonuclease/exonuclease/phosphatase [Zychaea mexicana]|uniref:Endonuclease/exonuclease/phosphatase n=1 Tax=Zychaea mexicana TaxID=64656 RepID=UPI0022FF23E5|nr:Endonuclease/exonuclease/phosphatase [Zychaea mexicana]KAI9488886.1 Endonuclease/exonuclease/phosphatase [Zychaea mexicana]